MPITFGTSAPPERAAAAARGTTGGGRPAITAAFPSYKMASKQETNTKPQQAQLQSQGTRPDELPSGCGCNLTDHAVRTNSSPLPFGTCRSHFPANTRPAGGDQENIATAASGGPARRTQATRH